MQNIKFIFIFITWIFSIQLLMAGGAPSTYFNIYLPPNNDAVKRDVALIVTAIYDNTEFTITDDNADGDGDDTVTGTLAAGQSYILYIRDNGINDDAQYASGGTLKRDGDYFFIHSSKLVFASMSTDSDWQHDFVPSVNKTSLGGKFIIYAPKVTNSKRDLNVFAFEDNTTITISQISTVPTTQTGYTNVDLEKKTIVKQRTLNRGQDIIHFFQDGRDIMETGATYMIEANKNVSVQYGALWTNSRDGGGYVPSSNGSSSGELFYFAVPYQANGEQEIRIASWDPANTVTLERFENGNWIMMKTWTLDRLKPADWIGKKNGNATYPTVFRVKCSPGKKVAVFECNWMETGSIGTSDMASMVSSEDGTDSGKEFLVYLLPPAKQQNVVNPFTGQLFAGNFTHNYIYAGNQITTVTVKDAKTSGSIINRSYTIQPNRYVDVIFSEAEWKSIYNGNGNPDTGPDRPYVLIESNHNVSVMNANTNDNWMMYFGSSLESAFSQTGSPSQNIAIPGDTVTYVADVFTGTQAVTNPSVSVIVGSGGIPLSSTLTSNGQTYEGVITNGTQESQIVFNNLPDFNTSTNIDISTELVISPSFNNGAPMPNNTIITVESVVSGTVNGQTQQSVISHGIQNNSANHTNLLFDQCGAGILTTELNDSWSSSWVDYNNDGWEDIFVTDRNPAKPNTLYRNIGGNFTKVTGGSFLSVTEKTIASAWGDFNNDGFLDPFIVNATGSPCRLFKNVNGVFTEILQSGIDADPQYFHGAAWVDLDNDGFLDLIITNFFETKFHQMYRNNGNETFIKITDNPIVNESNRSTMPALADYNNDGLVDVFIPNGQNKPNSLFRNLGNGKFEKVTNAGSISSDTGNSVGAAWGDFNNDGHMDVIVLNASKQVNPLYKNLGNGSFEKVNTALFNQHQGDTHSGSWIDHDNDGDLDLFITNDEGVSYYYINNGDETFSLKLAELLTGDIVNAMGSATADYNKDGKVDIFVTSHTNQKNMLFCNQSDKNNKFISIRLVGTASNKSAIGAKIKVTANGSAQYREVLPVQGLGSQSSFRQHFGVGQASQISNIEIRWPSGYVQTVSNVNTNQFVTITEEAANSVEGYAFSDENNNCIWDNGESKIENMPFTINNNVHFTSRNNGAYSMRVGQGSHSIALVENEFWEQTCPTNASFSGVNNTKVVNIPLKKKINEADLGVNFGITAWRRGFTNESVLTYFNQGTTNAQNSVISVTYPDGIDLKSASTPWTEKNGNTYIWNISEIPSGKSFVIQMVDSVTLNVTVGQILPMSTNITTTTAETQLTNNTQAQELEIVGAIDPNDLLVTPKGKGKEGLIPKNQVIRYHIRFQNVGTYYASRVVLENQLSKHLDIATFKIESVSHDKYNFLIDDKGMLTVRFNNIYLPDSTTNEGESHGFFIYTIQPKKDLNGGERIENSVLITFDYEEPIQTNTVVNTIYFSKKPEVGKLIIYPNPANENVNMIADPEKDSQDIPLLHTVKICNSFGAIVLEIHNTENYQVNAYIQQLSPGIYSVFGFDYDGKIYQGKLVKL